MNNEDRNQMDDMNGDGMDGDYNQEDYENDGMMGNQMNNMEDGGNAGVGEGENEEVDQYFDDAGDIGYLPADHVRCFLFFKNICIAFDGTFAKRFDQAINR